ncbi:MAG: hypothetical protein ACLQUY_04760 [Ktedonobacterales bacterium]
MARLIRHRALAALVAIVVLIATIGVVVAASSASPQLTGWLSSPARTVRQPVRQMAGHTREPAAGGPSAQRPRAVSIQLAAQDVTPDSQLRVMASGFLSGEPLVVTIEDMHGQIYARRTLQADGSGRLGETVLALPALLGAGAYRLIVVGNKSHRTASATFQMNDIPPTVTLDAYTATPGQVVGFAGNGFVPGEVVMVYLGPSSAPLLSATATTGGAVSGHLHIPKLPAGTYTLTLRGKTSQTPASVDFNVQGFSPWVVLDRYTVAPGEGVGFIAHGFAPGEQVSVYLNARQGTTGRGTPVLRVTADPSGQLVVQDTWSPGGTISGTNVLTLVGRWSKATTTAEFTVQATGQQTGQPQATPTIP